MPTWNHTQSVDELTMVNHAFVKELWDGVKGPALRARLFDPLLDLAALQKLLNDRGFKIPSRVQIMVVDIEGGQTRNFPDPIVKGASWYALVLPPVPTKASNNPAEYKAYQAAVEALFHASNDGYGM